MIIKSNRMKDFPISYLNATITHVNKYNHNSGFVFSVFFFSSLFTDVVFKLEGTGEEIPITLKNLNLPVFSGQKIQLIAIEDQVVALLDKATNNYYFLTRNLQEELQYGLTFSWPLVVVMTVILFLLVQNFFGQEFEYTYLIFIIPAGLRLYQMITNFLLEQKISRQIEAS